MDELFLCSVITILKNDYGIGRQKLGFMPNLDAIARVNLWIRPPAAIS